MCAAVMRAEDGRDPHDKGLQNLVGELSLRSDTIRALSAAHNVRTHGAGTKRFQHPVVGELTLAYEELAITADRLKLLASWGADQRPAPTGTAAIGSDRGVARADSQR